MKLVEEIDLGTYMDKLSDGDKPLLNFWINLRKSGFHIEFYYKITKHTEKLIVKKLDRNTWKKRIVGVYKLM